MNREGWIRAHVEPAGDLEPISEQAWATVLRVPLANDGAAWFKACERVQAFEPGLTARLAARTPSLVPTVLAHDEERAWLLLADAGTPLQALGNPLDAWLEVVPQYAELQRVETVHADDHLAHGVPDQRPHTLPAAYEALLERDIGLEPAERARLEAFAPRFAELCAQLEQPPSIQHDDLHASNVYADDGRLTVLDWGDTVVGDPFASLFITCRWIEHFQELPRDDPWFARLRDAYLEPWGSGLSEAFTVSHQVAAFSRALTWLRIDPESDGAVSNVRRFLEEVVQE